MISVRSSAIESLMRTGILDSPNPGSSITMAPTRANTSMKAAASAGRSEISMRIYRASRLQHSHPVAIYSFANAGAKGTLANIAMQGDLGFDIRHENSRQPASECQIHRAAAYLHQPPMIRDDIRIIWLCSESAMNGSANSNVTKIARIFGTNISVCSWIWVSAWNNETTTPTTRP